MKTRYIFSTMVLLAVVVNMALAQKNKEEARLNKPFTVVMQVSNADSLSQMMVVGQARNIKKRLPNAQIEVVCHSAGLDLLVKGKSLVTSDVEELKSQNVNFVACENTMARRKVTHDQLITSAGTVPSGLVEIILKQDEGWQYVKGGQ